MSSMNNITIGTATIILCSVAYGLSFIIFRSGRATLSLFIIIFCGLLLRAFVGADFFLHQWDERYHALVAKHLMDHFSLPTLYEQTLLPYDFKNWAGNHIWLHKQPLPLWAMAASMKIFGINELALRLPSIFISTVSIYLIYKIAGYFFNERIAMFSAFLQSIHGLIIEITGGRVATDHIDIFFLFFIELSFFISIIQVRKRSKLWSIILGAAIGAAILCKWLPALIVFPVWMLISFKERIALRNALLNLLIAIFACLATFLPWQIFVNEQFPREAGWEQIYNWKHFSEELGGNGGPWYYYLNKIRIIYGELIYLPLIAFVYISLQKKNHSFSAVNLWLFIPLIFFSFIRTKMQGYLLFVSPCFFIISAWFFYYCRENLDKFRYKWILFIVMFLLIALPVRYAIERIKPFEDANHNPIWASSLRNLKPQANKAVLFGTSHYIEAMFYTDAIAYEKKPSLQEICSLKEKGYTIFVCTNDSLQTFERIK